MKKLLKYEMKSTWQVMIFLLILQVAGLLLSFGIVQTNLLGGSTQLELEENIYIDVSYSWILALMFSLLLGLAVIVLSYAFLSIRYAKELHTPMHGYLMHTLPVESTKLILSKTLIAAFWNFLIMICFEIGVLSIVEAGMPLALIHSSETLTSFGIIIEKIIEMISTAVRSVSGYLHIFAAISIGYSFSKYKILVSMGMYMVINCAYGILSIPFDFINQIVEYSDIPANVMIIPNIALAIICFIICKYFMDNKLNVK